MAEKLHSLFKTVVDNIKNIVSGYIGEIDKATEKMNEELDKREKEYEAGNVGNSTTALGNVAYVDLGLPSGLKWAQCNLGANSPGEIGDFYAWGETEPYYNEGYATKRAIPSDSEGWKAGKSNGYDWASYSFYSGDIKAPTKYNPTDNIAKLEDEDDVVRVKLGENWRMPTKADFEELLNNCNWKWTTYSGGASGIQFTSRINGATIFFPCSGYRSKLKLEGAETSKRTFDYMCSNRPVKSAAMESSTNYCLYFYENGSNAVNPPTPVNDGLGNLYDLSPDIITIWEARFPIPDREGAGRSDVWPNSKKSEDAAACNKYGEPIWQWDVDASQWKPYYNTMYVRMLEAVIPDNICLPNCVLKDDTTGTCLDWKPGDCICIKPNNSESPHYFIFVRYEKDGDDYVVDNKWAIANEGGAWKQYNGKIPWAPEFDMPTSQRKMRWKEIYGFPELGVEETSRSFGENVRPIMAASASNSVDTPAGRDSLGVATKVFQYPSNVIAVPNTIPMRNWACKADGADAPFSESKLEERLGLTVRQLSELAVGKYARVALPDGTLLTVTGASGDFFSGTGYLILGPARVFVHKFFDSIGQVYFVNGQRYIRSDAEGSWSTVYFHINGYIDEDTRTIKYTIKLV